LDQGGRGKKNQATVKVLLTQLDWGEAEVIALALEKEANLVWKIRDFLHLVTLLR